MKLKNLCMIRQREAKREMDKDFEESYHNNGIRTLQCRIMRRDVIQIYKNAEKSSLCMACGPIVLPWSICVPGSVYETRRERDPGVLYLRDTVPNDKNVLNHNVSCDKKVAQIHVWHCIVRGKNGIHLGVHRIGLGWRVLHS